VRTSPHTTITVIQDDLTTSGAGRSAERGEEVSTTKQSIRPTWLSTATMIDEVINTTSNKMIVGITPDPGAADKITFLGCPICQAWSN
jgi:hypothetical protein